ncbi:MAG: CBS domain-containing protein [Mariprofundaceae bacterium]|nr:CBS domain-containing protein [Mariprofundaceae bacterium]
MKANLIMTRDLVVCHPDQTVAEVMNILRDRSFRVVPVVDEGRRILGAINMLGLLTKLVPEYIVNGDLKSVAYAPDIGLLLRHYRNIIDLKVSDVMDRDPTIVHENDSLLSVAAALITYDRFEYAFVVNRENELLGIISASDILRRLSKVDPEGLVDA